MQSGRLFTILLGMTVLFVSLGCIPEDQATEGQTEIEIVPTPTPTPPPDPDTYVCDPFADGAGSTDQDLGIQGSLFYREPDQPSFSSVYDYFEFGTEVTDVTLFFNQLNVPTRPFDRGFITQAGREIQTLNGDVLYEWFALHFEGRLQLSPADAPGDYQFALLADDGAVLQIDRGAGLETIVDNDGTHPTRMGCSMEPVNFAAGDALSFVADYNQGPRYHIAMVVMWRPWPDNPDDVDDPLCGRQGNSLFFDSNQDPPEPQSAYYDLLARGWKVLAPENYLLPETDEPNPCNEPAPEITELIINNVTRDSATVIWSTDRASTSQVVYTHVVSGQTFETIVDPELVLTHQVQLTGLERYSLYNVKVISASSSGLATETEPVSFRTSR
jgi:hypothetical protein